MNEKIVVGLELQPFGTSGSYLVVGLVAFFKTHMQRYVSIEQLADSIALWPIEITHVPLEEGWDNVGELPKHLWQDLTAKIYDIRKLARLTSNAEASVE